MKPTPTSPRRLAPPLSSALRLRVETEFGLRFDDLRWNRIGSDLLRHFDEDALTHLLHGPSLVSLTPWLTVGESYFFRDPTLFQVLRRHVLPQLAAAADGAPVPCWSVGCAAGEEIYSLAILLADHLPHISASLAGSDINSDALARARQAHYPSWSLRDLPALLRDRAFHAGGPHWQLRDDLRQRARFTFWNLCADPLRAAEPAPFPEASVALLLCRNVLMYFAPEQAHRALARLIRYLRPGGMLVLSPAEMALVADERLALARFDGVTLLQRRVAGLQPITAVPLQVPSAPLPEPAPPPSLAPARPPARSAPLAANTAASGPPPHAPALLVALSPLADCNDLLDLARQYHQNGETRRALTWVLRVLRESPEFLPALYLSGCLLAELGQWQQAQHAFRACIVQQPDFIMGHLQAALVAQRRGCRDLARRHRRHALRQLAALATDAPLPLAVGLTAGDARRLLADIGGEVA